MSIYIIILLCAVGVLAFIDIRRKSVSVIGLIALFSFCVIYNLITSQISGISMLLGTLPAGAMLLMVKITGLRIGAGDILLIAALGAGLGAESVCIILFAASCLCAAVSGVLLGLKKIKKESTVAFIPFIGAGLAVSSFMQM